MSGMKSDYQTFIALSRYARWNGERRETWTETVDRYFDFMSVHLRRSFGYELDTTELKQSVIGLGVMPSMRALMTAGAALERDHVAGYNCAYLPIESPRCFDETMYILLCGTGVGFSVEDKYIRQLPVVNEHFEQSDSTINVGDSKAGWARGLRELIALLYTGQVPAWDTSRVRPAGARLRTFGGRASGPAPLESLFRYAVGLFRGARGRRLTSLECHDLLCKIGEVVVVGGVRRSAMISLSDLHDDRMQTAKNGNWWETNGQRALSNNSAVYEGRPSVGVYLQEWKNLYDSHSGERGIFNRAASRAKVESLQRRDPNHEWGTNPCSEIILRPYQFCNLTEVVVRSEDTTDSLRNKVRLATILGTFQSTLTDFKYLRKIWKTNTEEERLLGVSLTGIMDNVGLINDPIFLRSLREFATQTNRELAKELGIPASTAITCVKPSGTVSQLVDSASGIHPRHSAHYIRTVRGDTKDPLSQFLIDQGIPYEPDVTKPNDTVVFSFPQRSPDASIYRGDITAVEHLNLWKTIAEHWCEHKPSITVSVREEEWPEVQAWVWKNFDILSGVSFLPYSEHTYRQAPYQEVDANTYNAAMEAFPKAIAWDRLTDYEKVDTTTASQELACVGGSCDVI